MSVINTNITALVAQRNLNRSQNSLQTAMERLSSGLRINSAADDAAGQAIANRMTAQVNGLSQAKRNANDGISVAQTTEGALDQINSNLQRIRKLTVQAANDTNSQSDLKSIQAEINQRLAEVNRISAQTSFNGVKVLAKDQSLSIQVGAYDGQTIDIKLQKMDSGTLKLDGFSVVSDTDASGNDVVEHMATGDSITIDDGTTPVTWTKQADGTFSNSTDPAISQSAFETKVSDGVTAGSTVTATLASLTGDTYTIASSGVTTTTGTKAVYVDAKTGDLTTTQDQIATTNPLDALDSALDQVNNLRSSLGAIQNRFHSAISNLSTTTINLTSARSRIEDADYAVEVSNMTRGKILQQAGTAVLAQANKMPQTVLSLLR